MRLTRKGLFVSALAVLLPACGGQSRSPQQGTTAPGEARTAKTAALESAANVIQSKAPVGQLSMYMSGFHAAKDQPALVIESDHYCNQVSEDFAQCVLFDGTGKDARLHGVEFIISEKLYAQLPPEERMYWHPHNYEILSGELVMPGVPTAAEHEAMQAKINSYGKTWHFWKTGLPGQPADPLPYGPPHLAWSFNHDGELPQPYLTARDSRAHTDTAAQRQDRASLQPLAHPQGGVDALRGSFPSANGAPAGVQDNGDAHANPVPTMTVKPPNSAKSGGGRQ